MYSVRLTNNTCYDMIFSVEAVDRGHYQAADKDGYILPAGEGRVITPPIQGLVAQRQSARLITD